MAEVSIGSLGDKVWLDANQNGIQDAGEAGMHGVTVNLEQDLGAGPMVLRSAMTQPDGSFLFESLQPGNYTLKIVPPPGFVATIRVSNRPGEDSNPDPETNRTGTISLTAGETNATVDAGFYRPGTLGNLVFLDANGNGFFDLEDSRLGGARVQLWRANLEGDYDEVSVGPDGVLGTPDDAPGGMLTDIDGYYCFTGLPSGTYHVEIPSTEFVSGNPLHGLIPAGNSLVAPDADDDKDQNVQHGFSPPTEGVRTAPVELVWAGSPLEESGAGAASHPQNRSWDAFTDLTVDLGLRSPMLSISVSSDPLPAATMGTGYSAWIMAEYVGYLPYEFSVTQGELPAGLNLNASTGELFGIPEGPPGVRQVVIGAVDAAGHTKSLALNFVVECPPITISYPEAFLAFGVEFSLEPVQSGSIPNPDGPAPTWSLSEGALPPGLSLDSQNGRILGVPTLGGRFQVEIMFTDGWGCNASVTLELNVPVARIKGQILVDTDGDDTGNQLLTESVTVVLVDALGMPVDDPNQPEVQDYVIVTTTGNYEFRNIPLGDYVVRLLQPDGWITANDYDSIEDTEGSPDDNPNWFPQDNEVSVSLADGETDSGNTFVVYEAGRISGKVMLDRDGDGVGDAGIPAVRLQLSQIEGEDTAVVETDESGYYVFTNLKRAAYQISKPQRDHQDETAPLDLLSVDLDADRGDSPSDDVQGNRFNIFLARGELDSGNYFLEVNPASIGGEVRNDTMSDGSESAPAGGVSLELLYDPNQNGLPDDAYTVQIDNGDWSAPYIVQTDESGEYQFQNLLPGSYLIRLITPDGHTVRTGLDATEDAPRLPSDPANDQPQDDFIALQIAGGETDSGNNFRIVLASTVQGMVLLDEDDNGTGDSLMADVLVELRTLADEPVDDPNQPGVQRYIAKTDSVAGAFEFSNLIPGRYIVVQLQPQGFTSTSDEDTTTDSPALPEDGSNSSASDNIIPTHVAMGETDDGHLFVEERVIGLAVGNLVFSDLDGDGNFEPYGNDENPGTIHDNDGGLAGVQVQLWKSLDQDIGNRDDVQIKAGKDGIPGTADDLTSATETDPAGRYLFSGLAVEGTYYVKIPSTELGESLLGKVSSSGQQVDQTQDDNLGENGDDDSSDGFTSSLFTLTFNAEPVNEMGQPSPQPDDNSTNLTIDFGFFGPAGITGRVWNDQDNNNTPDDPMAGVAIVLFDNEFRSVDNPHEPDFQPYEVTTDEQGTYAFTDLPPGNYVVRHIRPDSHLLVSARDTTEDLLTSPPDRTTGMPADGSLDITLAASETDTGNDFILELGVSISGIVVFDENGDGAADQPLGGVQVLLTDDQGATIHLQLNEGDGPGIYFTDGGGAYQFPLLPPGTYGVRVVPSAFQVGFTDSDGGHPLVYAPRALTSASDTSQINFLLTKALAIGNLIFVDLNADGSYTSGVDRPVPETPVLCYRDEDQDGYLLSLEEQTPVASVESNEDGRYLIDNLRPGHYMLQIPPAAFVSGPLVNFTPARIPENPSSDDDDSTHDALPAQSPEITGVFTRPIILSPGGAPTEEATGNGLGQDYERDSDVNLTVDFGFIGGMGIYGSVYADSDRNNELSEGDDHLAASQVFLWLDRNNNNTLDHFDVRLNSQFTDTFGSYGFESLPPGRYFVESALMPGAARVTNSEGGTGALMIELADQSDYDNWFLDRISPTGYLYSSRTKAIIPGGRVYPGDQSGHTHLDGSSGRYFMTPAEGSREMALHIVPPPGWKVDPNGRAGESPFQAPAVSGGHVLGSAESLITPGFLSSSEQQNSYYESFTITEGPQPYGYNAVIYNNIPLVEVMPTTFAEWLYQRRSSSERAYEDSNGNGFNNLLEFAFGLPADSNVIPHAPIRIAADPTTGRVLVCHLALQQSEGVRYFLEVSQDLFKNPQWHRIETLTPSAVYNPDGTQYVCYSGIEDVLPWLAEGRGFVRVVVDVDVDLDGSIDFATASSVSGWQSHSHAVAAGPEVASQTTTFANPFIKFTAWQGSLTGANPTQIFTQGPVDGAMRTDSCYVLEILNGPLGGHRFGLDPAGSAGTTLQLALGSPFTTTVPVDESLGGADAVIRELWRLNDVLPPTRFRADGDPDAGDNALLFENGQWRSFYAVSTTEGTVWADVTTALPTDSGANKYLDPAQALFVVRRGGALSTVIAGQVRTTPFAVPLKVGYNLVGAVFPGGQTISERGMDNRDVFRGHAESTQADQLLLWKGDFVPGKNGYLSYFLLDLGQPFQFWTGISDVYLHSVNDDALFGPTSAAFYLSRREHSDWIMHPPRRRDGEP